MAVLCSGCSGKLIFNPASQMLECVVCGNRYSPEDVEDKSAKLNSKYYSTRVYTCDHCGAEVITSDTEASTFCVYCGNPAIAFSRISEEYRPDGLIPFKITKEEAIKCINMRFLKNPFVPKEVKDMLTPDNIRGIYIPYWIVNANYTEADILSGEVKRGKMSVKLWYSRAGNVELNNLPIDGSRILNDTVSSKLEPFYLDEAKEFDEDYLNGFYSNTSDLTYIDLKNSAAQRCHKLFEEDVLKTIKARKVKIEDSIRWIDIMDDPLYMMLPVWFFTFRYEGKPYTIMVTGQSGKVVGTFPWNIKKITWVGIVLSVLFMALTAYFFIGMYNGSLGALTPVSTYITGILMVIGISGLISGWAGLNKIRVNLKLTQEEGMFKFVKRRQA
ncbi:MAG: hypothetical protein IJ757_07470 [Clostridiales bacterium]|nr:hypothetical protein [Clostridiales bacterium]